MTLHFNLGAGCQHIPVVRLVVGFCAASLTHAACAYTYYYLGLSTCPESQRGLYRVRFGSRLSPLPQEPCVTVSNHTAQALLPAIN
ncbi:hypothetical protein, partial [Planktothricoides raciborskii]